MGPTARALPLTTVLMLATTGCGLIFGGTRQTITANSAPDQAAITVDPGGQQFTTPASMSLQRKNEYVLRFSKDGYSPATFQIRNSIRGGIVVLDILTGLIGVVIDAATGAWYKLSPETATVTLTRTSSGISGPDEIRVFVTKDGKNSIKIESSVPGVGIVVQKR